MIKKLFVLTWLKLRVEWSNIRNKNNLLDYPVDEQVRDMTFSYDVFRIAKTVYNYFTYAVDGISELLDSMRYPAQCYHDYKQGLLKDDCDGFHACMYHIVQSNGFDCALLTYMVPKLTESHTVLVMKRQDNYYKLDYRKIYTYNSFEDIISELEKKQPLLGYNLVKFNEDKKWHTVDKL